MPKIDVDEPATGVRRITFNNPESLNAFDNDMFDMLIAALESVKNDLSVRVIILTGAGRGFCAGADTKNSGKSARINPAYGRFQANSISYSLKKPLVQLIKSLPQPVIAAVNGPAAGVGYALAVASDLVIVSKTAKFVNAIHNAGTGTELGMSYLLPRIVGLQKAARLLYTAKPVLAPEAVELGLALEMVEPEDLMPAALRLADDIMVNSPFGIWVTKQALWLNQNIGFEAALELEARGVHLSQATEDATEKRASSREKRRPVFKNT